MWLISQRRVSGFKYVHKTGYNAPVEEIILIDLSPEEWILECKVREEEVRNLVVEEGRTEQFSIIEVIFFARKIDGEIAEQLEEFF